MSDLPNRLEQDDRYRCRQIQTACAVHWDGDAIVDVGRKQILRQPFGLTAKDKKIAGLKSHCVVGPVRFRCEKEIANRRTLRRLQFA